jgi:hypothetical protein
VVQAAEDQFGVHNERLLASIRGANLLLVKIFGWRTGNTGV